MIPDTSQLLDDLTAAPHEDADTLVEALRLHQRRKTIRRTMVASGLGMAALAAGLRLIPQHAPPASVGVGPARSAALTQSELLDSFGDQPVALVTWPDGREQLLAILPPRLPAAAR